MQGQEADAMAVRIKGDQTTGKQLFPVGLEDLQQRRSDDFRDRAWYP